MSSASFSLQQQTNFVLRLFLVLLAVEIANILSARQLNNLALIPRDIEALWRILISPFLHGNIWHFGSNILPLCLFVWLSMQYGKQCFWRVSVFVFVGTGLLVWAAGRDAYHLGASGVVYGYFGFLLYGGFVSGRIRLLLLSLAVGFFFGGLIFGVLPVRGYVSWESHLFGFLLGLVAAFLFVKKPTEVRLKQHLNK